MREGSGGAPPNLLVIVSDEHRRDAMGAMGHGVVRTPHLDRLAAEGTLFTNAVTPSPMCVPARAALATGRHIHATGHWDSAAPYDGTPRSWMHALRDRGAEVVSFGKLHFRSGEDDNGFTREVLPMHVVGGHGWTIGLLREDPPPFAGAAELAADIGAGETEYSRYDRRIAAEAADWLAARRPDAGPWAAFVSFVTPHYPLRAPAEFLALYDAARMPLPHAASPDELSDHPEIRRLAGFYDYQRHFTGTSLKEGIAAYFALVSFMDACVGSLLAALDASGLGGQTHVLYISDHGELLGDHGLWTKQVMYEASLGVPMILKGPGIPAGRRVGTPVSLIDVAPTAAGLFGAGMEGLPGRPLTDLAREPDDPGRTAFSEYHDGGSSTGTFMVRWSHWKYVHYVGLPPQLFDLAADPGEVRDLGRDASEAAVAARAEGLRRLHAICDPEKVSAAAFADQHRRIEALGGREACRRADFGHTPAPLTTSSP
ncbi:MAG: sulfatase-like hydrolase/transferase [Hyphomicrobiaceae bacterium]